MVKIYIRFEDLGNAKGNFKPSGTLGKHNCTVVHQNETIIVIGSVSGHVSLREGDTLGYDCGKVWLVPKPESYKDPIRRVLALAKVRQKALDFSDDPVRYSVSVGRCLNNSSADTDKGERRMGVLGNYDEREVPNSRWDASDEHGFRGAFSFENEIIGGDAVVISVVSSFEETTRCQRHKVSRIIVRKSADRNIVAEWLEELITPEGQEKLRQRKAAEESAKAEQDEVDKNEAKKLWAIIVPATKDAYDDGFEFKGEKYVVSHNPNRVGDPKWASLHLGGIGRYSQVSLLRAYRSGILQSWVEKLSA